MADPTPTQERTPEEIARAMDDFRRSVLLTTGAGWQHHIPVAQRTRARNQMVKAGLVEKSRLSGLDAYRLTDLGRAVAQALREQGGSDAG